MDSRNDDKILGVDVKAHGYGSRLSWIRTWRHLGVANAIEH